MWKLEKKKGKLVIIEVIVSNIGNMYVYNRGYFHRINPKKFYQADFSLGEMRMLRFLVEELVEQSAYTIGKYTIQWTQQKLGDIVYLKLGERK
jgi:hypothetical protein